MPHTQTLQQAQQLASWPRMVALVRPDGSGSLTINGTERACAAASLEELRTGVIARCVAYAIQLGRPVRLDVDETPHQWTLAVRADGIVQEVDETGSLPTAEGLAPIEGRCRVCRHLEPVIADACSQCATPEPHRVELDANVSESAQLATIRDDESQAEQPPADEAPRELKQRLQLTLNGHAPIVVKGYAAIGRDPEPVNGRTPIRVHSPEQLVSRTHLFVDVDEAGRIIVTDNSSGNGTEAQTEPPMELAAGTPYALHSGTTLHLGDATCRIDLIPARANSD
ncbi:hypothetical protein C5E10_13310 [Pseudoclavibacter sp. RFBG4]|uniref:FHA domain-containing protein n=1 Tax=Pseudoclavibacter sp. RFBG4 TaxID=2080575 RepID=UPI000CE87639|nr:FHA domain-containing protein [Pseudoclavibacter sp. RFBG4]PPG28572.1 hypothetical protein C5E10_13310 [Pseudoclavibacter sp. RFBG4]